MLSTFCLLKYPALVAAFAGFALLLTGCPDPNGEFDKFGERYDKIDHTGPPAECGATAKTIEGDFFMALSAKLAPKKPITFIAKVTTEADGMHFEMTALNAQDRKTPVGMATTVGGYPIGADGKFTADLPELTVPGEANPITVCTTPPNCDGSIIVAKTTLSGAVCEDLICGDVSGTVSKPLMLPLDGSTFTFTRVEMPGDYPDPPPINCKQDLADPLK